VDIGQQDHIRADALRIVRGSRNDRGNVAAGHRLPEPEIRSQYPDAVGNWPARNRINCWANELPERNSSAARPSTSCAVRANTAASVTV